MTSRRWPGTVARPEVPWRIVTWAWIVQFFAFMGLALAWLFFPGVFDAMADDAPPLDHLFVEGVVRIGAPLAICMAMLSSYAAMREDRGARKAAAAIFAVTLVSWAWQLDHGMHTAHVPRWVIGGIAAFGALNGLYALAGGAWFQRPRRGVAATKPPELWAAWLFQAVAMIATCVLTTLLAGWLAGWIAQPTVSAIGLAAAKARIHLLAPLWIGMAGWTLVAVRANKEWHWRALKGVFRTGAILWLLVALYAWNGSVFRPLPALLCAFVMVIGLVLNTLFGPERAGWVAEDIGEGPDGWTAMELVSGPILILQSLSKRRRATHLYGAGARGTMAVPAEAKFPRHDFFVPGRVFPVQARFANVTFPDDCALDVHGAAIRLSDGPTSPFDMLLDTGAYAASHNMVHFSVILVTKSLGTWSRKLLSKSNIQGREGGIAALRRSVPCPTDTHYYSQTVRYWVDQVEDIRHLVRYRLVPMDPDAPEPGLMTAEDNIFERWRRSTETRSIEFSRREMRRRLEAEGEIKLRFQAMFHRPKPGEGVQWFDATLDWDYRDHPWVDVGIITLTDPLPEDVTELLRFNSANHPPSLGVPVSPSVTDPRSMADSEKRIIARLQGLRQWMYDALGLPKAPRDPQ